MKRNQVVSQNKLDYIDSLRGIAILLVILVHTSQSVSGLSKISSFVTRYGQMGVQLFFILSAFTLSLSFDKKMDERGALLFFYIRRYFRIAPMYYMGILIYFIFNTCITPENPGTAISNPYHLKNILANIFFVHGFYSPANNNIVPGGWSIGTEMAFYAIFPFIFLAVKKLVRNITAILLMPLISLFLAWIIFTFIFKIPIVENNTFWYFNLLNQLPVFSLGISYYFFDKLPVKDENKFKYLYLLAFGLSTVLVDLLLVKNITFTIVPFLSGIAFIFLIRFFKYYNAFSIGVLRRIGQLSFSMYILHFLFAWYLAPLMVHLVSSNLMPEIQLPLFLIITIFSTFLLALFTERTIEKKGIELGRQIILKIKIRGERNGLAGT